MAQIEAASGVSHDTIKQLLVGQRRIARSTAVRLLAVELRLEGRALVDGAGTRRRLQALLRAGWSHPAMQAATGVSTKMLVRQNVTGMVTADVAERVRVVFDALSMRPGPSPITARRAAALGYLPPLAWDDDTIDDPTAQPSIPRDLAGVPDPITVDLLIEGAIPASKVRAAERREAIRVLAGRGLDDRQIGLRLRMGKDAVCQTRLRNGIPAGVPRTGTLAAAS